MTRDGGFAKGEKISALVAACAKHRILALSRTGAIKLFFVMNSNAYGCCNWRWMPRASSVLPFEKYSSANTCNWYNWSKAVDISTQRCQPEWFYNSTNRYLLQQRSWKLAFCLLWAAFGNHFNFSQNILRKCLVIVHLRRPCLDDVTQNVVVLRLA